MKARQIVEALHGKCDPKLLEVLVSMAETLGVQQQEIDALGMGFDKVTGLTEQMISAGVRMKDKLDRMRGDPDDTKPVSGTPGLIKGLK